VFGILLLDRRRWYLDLRGRNRQRQSEDDERPLRYFAFRRFQFEDANEDLRCLQRGRLTSVSKDQEWKVVSETLGGG
jgi:hypothetical protein